jgi:ATP-binding protein involved in chromosome partitioning
MRHQDKQVPRAIRRRPAAIEIDWGEGAEPQILGLRSLRVACPCAACVDEMSGRRILDPSSIPEDIHAEALELVGAYGLRIRWSDGHGTGIYTFDFLREHGG